MVENIATIVFVLKVLLNLSLVDAREVKHFLSDSPFKKQEVSLDTLNDVGGGWTVVEEIKGKECFYDDNITDFEFGWGCGGPETNELANSSTGYWSACKIDYCSLVFYNESFQTAEIFIQGMVKGNAMIQVTAKTDPMAYNMHIFDLKSGDNGFFAGNITINMHAFQKARLIEFRIISANDGIGYALLDKIILSPKLTSIPQYDTTTEASAPILISKYVLQICLIYIAHILH